jgi:hypothetical protein
MDDQERAILAAYRVLPPVLGVPTMDGRWTTAYADWLDSVGMYREAHAERHRAVCEARAARRANATLSEKERS